MPENKLTFTVDQEMMVRLRRELHMYPELGWELTKTSALVRKTLDEIGIAEQCVGIVLPTNEGLGAGMLIVKEEAYLQGLHDDGEINQTEAHQKGQNEEPSCTRLTAVKGGDLLFLHGLYSLCIDSLCHIISSLP